MKTKPKTRGWLLVCVVLAAVAAGGYVAVEQYNASELRAKEDRIDNIRAGIESIGRPK